MRAKNFKIKEHLNVYAVLFSILSLLSSCKKFIEIEAPYTSFNGENVYTTDATAISAVTSMYAKLGSADAGLSAIQSVTYNAGLSADELTLFPGNSGTISGYYKNDLSANLAPTFWDRFYEEIYLANAAIEGLNASLSLTQNVKDQLLGEAKFIRAFCYFYLINLYGNVPLVLNTNYKQNAMLDRSEVSRVYEQVKADLLEAKNILSSGYVGPDVITSSSINERVRPNKWVAAALLARVYLYSGDYSNAEIQATDLINNSLYSLSSLMNVFLKSPSTNKEAIWQIQTITTGWNTNDARVFILPGTGPNNSNYPFYLNKRLINSFESNDNRRTVWVNGIKVGVDSFYYPFKYKSATLNASITEYNVVFRLAEQYLIRAEARAQQGFINTGVSDLNVIRSRAGLSNITASTKEELISAVLKERRVELFCEWGSRWFDLKRNNKIDDIMKDEAPLKGGEWDARDKLYPISLEELIANPNLTQTPGY